MVLKCPCCNNLLYQDNNVYKCNNKHSFDISNKGYVNLLLANQKHSLDPGDSKQSIISRVNFFNLDYYHLLKEKLTKIINKYKKDDLMFVDLACGEGYYTTYIHQNVNNITTIGVDISKQAIIEACKKKRSLKLNNLDFCIANIFNLPFIDNYFDIGLNCFAPISINEFRRILKQNGYFIRVLPGKYHLYELKEVLYQNVILNQMKEKQLDGFKLIEQINVNDTIYLQNQDEINYLLSMTPYNYKSPIEGLNKLKYLDNLKTRISFVILLYQKTN